ncbi:MAG: penicillin-binding protein activator [Burkholderiales bacterium]|nr:penicillin-binding protein activator [Burkholderiales bacterium]MDR4517373.1 penicillin-binding protein activator [Nitrosomonas sp.]
MQRFYIVIWVIVVTLYGNISAFATHPDGYYPGAVAPPPPPVSAYAPVPHIALMLPLQSSAFGSAAETVKEGFVTAAKREPAIPLTIRVYSTTDDPLDILITYHQALDAGAVLIVGPLTRNGVTALASSHVVEVPTLALNTTDMNMMLPSNLYLFGLQMESEANYIADMALSTHKNHAIIIKDSSRLSVRLQTAFADRWLSEYGNTAESVEYDEQQAFFSRLRKYTGGGQNLVFLALDADKVRRIRSYLNPVTPVYATSQIFVTNQDPLFNHDLNGIQFVDMPWLLQPDHPAVMTYRGSDNMENRDKDSERLYALGIDAFRLMRHMLQVRSPYDIEFDGVTGHIRFAAPAHFIRKPVAAVIDKGKVQLLEKSQ